MLGDFFEFPKTDELNTCIVVLLVCTEKLVIVTLAILESYNDILGEFFFLT